MAKKFYPLIVNIDNIGKQIEAGIQIDIAKLTKVCDTGAYYESSTIIISMGYAENPFIPFSVGYTTLQGISIDSSKRKAAKRAEKQATEMITLTETLFNKKKITSPLVFFPDVYQNQKNIVVSRVSYKIDSLMIISAIHPNTRCQLRFYRTELMMLAKRH